MPRVLIADQLSPAAVAIFKERGVETDVKVGLAKDELERIIGGYDGLAVRSATKATEKIIAAASKLRVIGRAGIGVDNIDVRAATAKGIIVMNTPFGNSITTAEHAIALMMALARQIPEADRSTQAGKWEKSKFLGVELYSKTLGVIGCGNIGSIVAERAVGLKMKVIAYDPFLSPDRAIELGVEKVELDDLLRRADFITLHTPLTDRTRSIIDAAALAKTKKGVRIVNCARGGLVEERALAAALKTGHVGGAAFDVFEVEPAKESPLFGLPNVICTPHLGASTGEAQENVALQVAEQMSDYLLKGAISNAVNFPNITAEEAPRLTPWVKLAEQLGSFAGQLTESSIKGVRIEYSGEVATLNTNGRRTGGRAAAAARRRQHGLRRHQRQGARHAGRGGHPRPGRRLRELYPPDRQDRRLRSFGCRHRVLRRPSAHHPGAQHRHGVRGGAAHAVRAQRRQAWVHRPLRHADGRGRAQYRHLEPRPRQAGRRCHLHGGRRRAGVG
jgi:D-3-phosphoglycerate dehydrogenase